MLKHVDEVDREGQCARPVPVVLPTNTFFREANKILAPDCTIVYQCRNDSGCCNASSVCAPKTTTNITRLFMVSSLHSMLEAEHKIFGWLINDSIYSP